MTSFARPFGAEYAHCSKWGRMERAYIATVGMVDLPTRIRARATMKILNGHPHQRFLDLGAGTGVYSLYLSRSSESRGLVFDIDRSRLAAIVEIANALQRP